MEMVLFVRLHCLYRPVLSHQGFVLMAVLKFLSVNISQMLKYWGRSVQMGKSQL